MIGRAGHRGGAFTLVELLVVLVILGIAASIVVAVFGSTGDLKTAAAARKLTSDLQYAQNFAITHQTKVRVAFDASGNSYTLLSVPDAGSATVMTHPITHKPYVVTLSSDEGLKNVSLGSVDFSGSTAIDFDALGAPDQGGQITVVSGSTLKTLTVAPVTGKISIQ
ncbi:MAG: hypothetical protein BIFFINMI_01613 [Phycisphaerae bacterium]|nr:hypothetical protein [Phycisphaerae bacterium]